MQAKKRLPPRSTVDLSDLKQAKALRKRFRISEDELCRIVERTGASIAAIGKEVALQRANRLPPPADVPAAAVIAATETAPDQLSSGDVAAA